MLFRLPLGASCTARECPQLVLGRRGHRLCHSTACCKSRNEIKERIRIIFCIGAYFETQLTHNQAKLGTKTHLNWDGFHFFLFFFKTLLDTDIIQQSSSKIKQIDSEICHADLKWKIKVLPSRDPMHPPSFSESFPIAHRSPTWVGWKSETRRASLWQRRQSLS